MKDRDYPVGRPVGVIEHFGDVRRGHYANKKGMVIIHSDDRTHHSQLILFHKGRGYYRDFREELSDEDLKNMAAKFVRDYVGK